MGRWSWPWGLMLAVVGSVEIGCRCAGDDPVANSGYGSVVDSRDFDLTAEEKQALLTLARTSVETWVRDHQRVPTDELVRKFPKLNTQRACFVTLRRDGQLRGCIGSLEPYRALVQDVRDNAVSAAMHDTRFRPVEASELSSLRYSLSVLDMPRPLQGVPPSPGSHHRASRSSFDFPSIGVGGSSGCKDIFIEIMHETGRTIGLLDGRAGSYQYVWFDQFWRAMRASKLERTLIRSVGRALERS